MNEGSNGFTPTEKWLGGLARTTFLSLWSFPNLFRDQRPNGATQGDGKEICDLTIVFGNSIVIFSDKSCEYKPHPEPFTAWARWFRASIDESFKQAYGAEKWIKSHPDRVYLDKECKKPANILVNRTEELKFYKILVCHNLKQASLQHFGESRNFTIDTNIHGNEHASHPFVIGNINPIRGFAHVMDTDTISTLLASLSTISDFIHYLERKEKIINKGRILAHSELDILGAYYHDIDDSGFHFIPVGDDGIAKIPSSSWRKWVTSIECKSKIELDDKHKAIDDLIEHYASHLRNKSFVNFVDCEPTNIELTLRSLALENRFTRRTLSQILVDFIKNSPSRIARRIPAINVHSKNHYVLVVLSSSEYGSYDEYREARIDHLTYFLGVHRIQHQDGTPIIGLATETAEGTNGGRSEDLAYIPAYDSLDPEMKSDFEACHDKYRAQKSENRRIIRRFKANEYPISSIKAKIGRNEPCPCGSGKKSKRCCG